MPEPQVVYPGTGQVGIIDQIEAAEKKYEDSIQQIEIEEKKEMIQEKVKIGIKYEFTKSNEMHDSVLEETEQKVKGAAAMRRKSTVVTSNNQLIRENIAKKLAELENQHISSQEELPPAHQSEVNKNKRYSMLHIKDRDSTSALSGNLLSAPS